VQAGIIAGEITDLILLDVTPLSLGVETQGGLMTPVITRNASIPVKQTETFTTGVDSQTIVEIHVLQGERPLAKDNKSLGVFQLKDIPAAPRGIPKIIVTFQLDVNGLLAVSAREEQSGKEQSIQIEGASVLAREDVAKMIKEAEENSKLDKAKKSFILLTYEIDNLILKAEKLLNRQIETDEERYLRAIIKNFKNSFVNKNITKCYQIDFENLKTALRFYQLQVLKTKLLTV